MRLLLVLLFIPTLSAAQDWKEPYITTAGDTITPQHRIAVADRLPIHHINPNAVQAQAAKVAAKVFVMTDMPGRTFRIDRLTRIPMKNGEYKAMAVIRISDADIMPGYAVDFYVDIESALKKGEVKFINASADAD